VSLPARTTPGSVQEPVREPERRYLVVWNPAAGSKAGLPTNLTREEDLRRTMRTAGLGEDLFVGGSEAATRRRIREAVAEGVDVIVAAGGDGTAILVAEEVMGTSSALGILPLGSAMNLGRSLGIPRDLAAAADLLATGEVVSVDVGKAPDGPFFQMVSVGISAAVLSELNRLIEGQFDSFVGAIRAIVAYRPATMRIELDDETVETHALMVVVANEPFTGAGLTLAPEASMDDGMFDVAVYRRFSRWELVRHLLSIVAGRRRYSPKVRTYRSTAVRISAHRPLPARADARDLGTTPIELEVIPGALRVVVAARESRPPASLGGPALSA
jgi:diacylglycerol kinase (ATP)